MTLKTIYIARHGYRSNWLPKDQQEPSKTGVDSDPVLAPHGRDQAEQLGQFIDTQLAPKPELIFSSPFFRCVETINPTAEKLDLPIYLDRGVGEWFKPDRDVIPEPVDGETMRQWFPRVSDDWSPDTVVPSNAGEDEAAIFARCQKFWINFFPKLEKQFPEAETVILVGHAASKISLGMALMGYANNREFLKPADGGDGKTTRIKAATCSIDKYVFDADTKEWHMKINGETDFLTAGAEMNWHYADSAFEAGSDADIAWRKRQTAEINSVNAGTASKARNRTQQ